MMSEGLFYADEQECHLTFAATGAALTALCAVLLEVLGELLGDPGEKVFILGVRIAVFAGMPDEDILLNVLAR
jgi:hypothetical protein